MTDVTLRDVPQGFSGLHSLLKGDALKLSLVARAFYRSVAMDLARLEQAADEGNWMGVCTLAQRIAIGCAQVSEHRAGLAVSSLSRLRDPVAMQSEYSRFRDDLADLCERATAFVDHYATALARQTRSVASMSVAGAMNEGENS